MEYKRFLVEANKFHIEGRYPKTKSDFYSLCTKEYTTEKFNKINEVYQWLKSQII